MCVIPDYNGVASISQLLKIIGLFCKRALWNRRYSAYMYVSDSYVCPEYYGVATISRLLKIIGLFRKRALWKKRYSAKETYNFKEPTNRSHAICICVSGLIHSFICEPWLIHSFICVSWLIHSFTCVSWLIYMCVMPTFEAASFIYVDMCVMTHWLIHTCSYVSHDSSTHSYVCHAYFQSSLIHIGWHVCDDSLTHSYMFICVSWLIHSFICESSQLSK